MGCLPILGKTQHPADRGGIEREEKNPPSRKSEVTRIRDIVEQTRDIIFVCRLRKHVRGEVAITALGPAERDRNVKAEGHSIFILWHARVWTVA